MKLFTRDTALAEVIHANYLLLPVINRFGIKLGFKDKSIAEVCVDNHVDIHFFLAIINTFHIHDYFPKQELQSFSCEMIVDYLRKSHLDFIKVTLPEIERLLINLEKSSQSGELKIVKSFYNKYKKELLEHIMDEEDNVFPYVLDLQKAYGQQLDPLPENIARYSIHSFEKEHTNVDEKLEDLKNIIIKFINPDYDLTKCNEFIFALFRFERDLHDHARIEDNILVPKVMEIEKIMKHGN